MLEPTGERLVPDAQRGELVLAEHLARYRLAARLAPGRRALDVACGEGYGTAMLAAAGAIEVTGVDIAPDAVAHARDRYAGVSFLEGDVGSLPFDDGAFDLVVSFETIEHVPEPERALDELARVTAPEGVLIISTPNPREYTVENEFHVRELDPDEFLAALSSRFAHVRPLYQQNYLASAVLDAGGLESEEAGLEGADVHKLPGAPPGRELYTLALCGHAPLPDLQADVVVLSGIHEAHRMVERMVTAERNQQDWEARARFAEAEVEPFRERAAEAERLVEEWRARAIEAERQNEEVRATLKRISSSLSWRVTKPLRRLRGRGG